jgi:hypothetical protein
MVNVDVLVVAVIAALVVVAVLCLWVVGRDK